MEILIGLAVIVVIAFVLWPKEKATPVESLIVVDLPAPTVTQIAAAATEAPVEVVAEVPAAVPVAGLMLPVEDIGAVEVATKKKAAPKKPAAEKKPRVKQAPKAV